MNGNVVEEELSFNFSLYELADRTLNKSMKLFYKIFLILPACRLLDRFHIFFKR